MLFLNPAFWLLGSSFFVWGLSIASYFRTRASWYLRLLGFHLAIIAYHLVAGHLIGLELVLAFCIMIGTAWLPERSSHRNWFTVYLFTVSASGALWFLGNIGAVISSQFDPVSAQDMALFLVAGSWIGIAVQLALGTRGSTSPRLVRMSWLNLGLSLCYGLGVVISDYLATNPEQSRLFSAVLLAILNFLFATLILRLDSQGVQSLKINSPIPHEQLSQFSPRENQVIDGIASGWTNKRIGIELHISEGTVRTHIYRIFQKAGVNSRIELLKKVGK